MNSVGPFLLAVCLVTGAAAVSIKDCGSKSIKLNTYSVSPNPIPAPGTIYVNSHFTILKEIDAPAVLEVKIKKKFWFIWLSLPCIQNLGSCNYQNGCAKLVDVLVGPDCPPVIEQWGLSCTCPLKAGEVNIVNKAVEISDFSGLFGFAVKGTYWAHVELKNPNTGEKHVCVEVEAEIK